MGAAWAQTYSSQTTAFAWIDPSSHAKLGVATTPYKFTNGSGCGTALPTLDDAISDPLPIGFSFKFGATNYTTAQVQTNGRLQFGNTTCGSGTAVLTSTTQTYPYPLPDASMNGVMKIFGVDLDPTNLVDVPNYPSAGAKTPCTSMATCYVSYATVGTAPNRKFVVTWKNVPEWVSAGNTSGSFDAQIVLNEDGSFVYQYGTIVHGGKGSAEVGWQVGTADFQKLSFGAAAEPTPNSAILFYIPLPVARFWFEDASYTGAPAEVVDSSGNLASGTALGGVQPVANGKICRAANIPGNASATVDAIRTGVNLGNASLNMLGAGTITLWYKATTMWSANNVPAQLIDATTATGETFYLTRTATGTLYFQVTDSTGVARSVETGTQTFAAGTWVHIAISWDFNGAPGTLQDKLRIWVNAGTPTVGTFTSNGTLSTALGLVTLGDNPGSPVGPKGTVNSANGLLDEVQFYNSVLTNLQVTSVYNYTHGCAPIVFDHLELRHPTGTGLTCTPTAVTLVACLNATCSNLYTGGVAGTLTATGGGATFDNTGGGTGAAFSIPAGSSTTTKGVQMTTVGSTVLAAGGFSQIAFGTYSCNFGTPACTLTVADSGLLLSVPNHVSETTAPLSISAVKKSDNSLACVPAFANVTRNIALKCNTLNPTTSTAAVRVNGLALNAAGNPAAACDVTGKSVPVAFDATGVGTANLQYADAGQLSISGSYTGSAATGDTGLVMTGAATNFVAAPASFGFSAITAGPIKAGTTFTATVTARNAAGAVTPNFGRETTPATATIAFTRAAPTGAGASNGVFSGSIGAFTLGSVSTSNLSWTEVGTGDLSATLVGGNYLASGLTVNGSTGTAGAVGRFTPHHFDLTTTPACGSFSYAGQPFGVGLIARNLGGATTVNYDGSAATSPNFAKVVTLSEPTPLGLGSLASSALPATVFTAGVGAATASYHFTNKTTAPQTLKLRATDADAISSLGFAEGQTPLRSGRLRLSNAFGSSKQALTMDLAAEYWTGQSWLTNSADNCSSLGAANVAISNPRNSLGNAMPGVATTVSSATLTAGIGSLSLAAPTPAGSSVHFDVALNLGATTTDQSCLPNHPTTTGAAKPWLRSVNGSATGGLCLDTADRDPAARASFGIYRPETAKTVHKRELF